MTILFVRGAPDDNIGEFKGIDARGNITWNVTGCCDVEQFVELPPGASASILLFGPKVEQSRINFHRRPTLVFNQIADPDSHAGALERCAEMCSQLPVPVINHPEKVLATTRDRVSATLRGITGVRMPQTIRARPSSPDEVFELAESSDVGLPLIVRLPGFHNGINMVLLRDREDYALLHALPFDGRDFYLTEFVNSSNDQGVYTKTRIAVIDGEPFFRHFLYDRTWKIHSGAINFMKEHPDAFSRDELANLRERSMDLARPALKQIHERLGLDYFGIDCQLGENGDLLIFEANATMNMLAWGEGRFFEKAEVIRDRVKALMSRRSGEFLG
jgi:glutathione synthase/RimK-type ligase-like ATP-grasp enzyme